jgi:hypothetical protein
MKLINIMLLLLVGCVNNTPASSVNQRSTTPKIICGPVLCCQMIDNKIMYCTQVPNQPLPHDSFLRN